MYSKYLHINPFLQSDDKKKQGESSKKEIKKFRELSFHAQSSEEDGGVEAVEPAPRPSTVSCGWWRAGHVTSTLTLIGPGGRGQRGAEPGQPPGPGPQPAPQEAHLRQQGGQRGHSQVRTLKHAAAEEARL